MRLLYLIGYVAFFSLSLSLPVHASTTLRCGDGLVQAGQSAAMVEIKIQNRGKILSKSTVGEQTKNENTEITEKWFVLIEGYTNYCYQLTFKGGALVEIGNAETCP